MSKAKPCNVRWGPADGGWQDPPVGDLSIPTAWTIEAMNPYLVHVYVYDDIDGQWVYQGVALESSLGEWEPGGPDE